MRVCEYFPISISNGENNTLYLENDYKEYDDAALEAELTEYKKQLNQAMEDIGGFIKFAQLKLTGIV